MIVVLTPVLPPPELEGLLLGEVLLDGVVDPLHQHVLEARCLQDVRHGGRVAERVDGPGRARLHSCVNTRTSSESAAGVMVEF